MTLADRLGLTEHDWYEPAAFVAAAFAVGIQLALLYQSIGPTVYPPAGKEALAWTSLTMLVALLVLHLPTDLAPLRRATERLRSRIGGLGRRRVLVLKPVEPATPPQNANGTTPHGPEPAVAPQRLKVRVHSPLAIGPVVAPGETIPVQVEAEPVDLARDLEVRFDVTEAGKTRTTIGHLDGTALVHAETFSEPGPLVLEVCVQHPEAGAPAIKRIEGRVATYREEVGRLFDDLRDRAMDAGLDVGPHSTPREVCRGLPSLGSASYEDAEALRTHLEVALYGDADVDRSTYEAVHTILRQAGLVKEEAASA